MIVNECIAFLELLSSPAAATRRGRRAWRHSLGFPGDGCSGGSGPPGNRGINSETRSCLHKCPVLADVDRQVGQSLVVVSPAIPDSSLAKFYAAIRCDEPLVTSWTRMNRSPLAP
jgi:hypothetical protein